MKNSKFILFFLVFWNFVNNVIYSAEVISKGFIIQNSAANEEFFNFSCPTELSKEVINAFGKFSYSIKWQQNSETHGVKKYSSVQSSILQSPNMSPEEIAFHKEIEANFPTLIREIREAGKAAFIPSALLPMAQLPSSAPLKKLEKQISSYNSLQQGQTKFYQTLSELSDYFETIESIDNKTYCIAAINFEYISAETPESHLIVLPYVFISDGMDPLVVENMETYLKNKTNKGGILDTVCMVDYYARDFHDTKRTLTRVSQTLLPNNKIHMMIKQEIDSNVPDFLIQIRKFAHAEQKALDRLAEDLPAILSFIIKDKKTELKGIRIHMLVNNDSCCRCDATIKASIAPHGWLFKRLRGTITELEKDVTLSSNFKISAYVSSINTYNSAESLNTAGIELKFYSRGLKEIALQSGNIVGISKALQEQSPVLKIYEFDFN